jgi:hypothetical protein
MVISLADFYGIPPHLFQKSGALDPILGIDTRLFIDPRLLVDTAVPELAGSAAKIASHFEDVVRLLVHVRSVGDPFWRQADRLLTFPEVRGLCIGYSTDGTAGRGMGPKKRSSLLDTSTRIVQAGVQDPTLFELVGAFEDGVGPDLISDMVAKIIMADLIAFTQRVCSDLGIPMESQRISSQHPAEDLPRNPETEAPLVLVPMDVLRDLPVAETFSDIFWIAEQNQALRDELNSLIGTSWRKLTTRDQKHGLRESFINQPGTLVDVIAQYIAEERERYDFHDDRSGEVQWYRVAREMPAQHKLELTLPPEPTIEDVFGVVVRICEHFAKLVQDNQLCRLLYDKCGERKHESAAQLLFFGIASSYCEANNLDLSPESDAGISLRGHLESATEPLPGKADVGYVFPFADQQVFGTFPFPSLVFFSNQVGNGNTDILEKDFVEMMLTVNGQDGANRDTLGAKVDEQEADALLLDSTAVRTNKGKHPVRHLRARGPGLLAVDDVMIASSTHGGIAEFFLGVEGEDEPSGRPSPSPVRRQRGRCGKSWQGVRDPGSRRKCRTPCGGRG